MALPNKEKYEQKKIDNLLHYLRLYHEKGQPIDFEILVDGFKAVRRTSDPDMFSMFENFVTADTRSIEILLFTGSSNNNEKRIFHFGEEQKEGLSGIEVKSMVDEEVQRKLREKEYDSLKEENSDLKQHIADLENEVEELEKNNARLELKQSPLNNFLGDMGSSLVESFIKRNPKLMAAFPGGEALAGFLQSDNTDVTDELTQEAEVSFKAKTGSSLSSEVLTEEQQGAIQFVNQLKAQFSKEEFEKVLLILQTLAEDKGKINQILNDINNLSPAA
jgi:cell division septum initiation protein DivIVA